MCKHTWIWNFLWHLSYSFKLALWFLSIHLMKWSIWVYTERNIYPYIFVDTIKASFCIILSQETLCSSRYSCNTFLNSLYPSFDAIMVFVEALWEKQQKYKNKNKKMPVIDEVHVAQQKKTLITKPELNHLVLHGVRKELRSKSYLLNFTLSTSHESFHKVNKFNLKN